MADGEASPDPRWVAMFDALDQQGVIYAAPHDLARGLIFVDGIIHLGELFAAIDLAANMGAIVAEYASSEGGPDA